MIPATEYFKIKGKDNKRKANPFGYYTGSGDDNVIQASKPVSMDLIEKHEGEFVLPEPVVRKMGGPNGVRNTVSKFMGGGPVRRKANVYGYQFGGPVGDHMKKVESGIASAIGDAGTKTAEPAAISRAPAMQAPGTTMPDTIEPPKDVLTSLPVAETKKPTRALPDYQTDIDRAKDTLRGVAKGDSQLQKNIATRALQGYDVGASMAQEAGDFKRGMAPSMTEGAKQAAAAREGASLRGGRSELVGKLAEQNLSEAMNAVNKLYDIGSEERKFEYDKILDSFKVQTEYMDELLSAAGTTGDYSAVEEQFNAMKADPRFADLLPEKFDVETFKEATLPLRLKAWDAEIVRNNMKHPPSGKNDALEENKPIIEKILRSTDPNWDTLTQDVKDSRIENYQNDIWDMENADDLTRAVWNMIDDPTGAFEKYTQTPEEKVLFARTIKEIATDYGITTNEETGELEFENEGGVFSVLDSPELAHYWVKDPTSPTGYEEGWNDAKYNARSEYVKSYKGSDGGMMPLGAWENAYTEALGTDDPAESLAQAHNKWYAKNTSKFAEATDVIEEGDIFYKQYNMGEFDEAEQKAFEEWRKKNPDIELNTKGAEKSYREFRRDYIVPISIPKSSRINYGNYGDTIEYYDPSQGVWSRMEPGDNITVEDSVSWGKTATDKKLSRFVIPKGDYTVKEVTVTYNDDGTNRTAKLMIFQDRNNPSNKYAANVLPEGFGGRNLETFKSYADSLKSMNIKYTPVIDDFAAGKG